MRFQLLHLPTVSKASTHPWPQVQRILIDPHIGQLLTLARGHQAVNSQIKHDLDQCDQWLQLPPEELDPQPLLTGNDLVSAGIRPGPNFKILLESIRDQQLLGNLKTRDEALKFAQNES